MFAANNSYNVTSLGDLDKAALGRKLRDAIHQGHIWPAFQPIIDIRSGAVAGFEILARWSDPELGEISPLTFIPLLEEQGLIDALTNALMQQACGDAANWPGNFFLAFNISPVQLIQEGLAERLVLTTLNAGFEPQRLQVEVTEGALLPDKEIAFSTLSALLDRGITISIDDFGTGYSNLERLSVFPFRKLKIDARFVRNLDADASKRRIVASLIGLGHSLGMSIVAEGVETQAEEAILRELGCDLGQGWLYSKAVRAELAFAVLFARGERLALHPPLDISPFQQLHQLDSLYRQAPVGLCFMDLHLRHVRANDRFARLHGLTAAELEGKAIDDVLTGDHLTTARSVLDQLLSGVESQTQEYCLNGRDILVISHKVIDVGGEVIGFSLVSLDVTEQNKSRQTLVEREAHFRNAVELGPNISWAATPEGIIDYMSHTSADTPEVSRREHVLQWVEKIHPDDRPWLTSYWLGWVKTGTPYQADFRVLWPDGQYRWVSSRALPHRDENGEIIRWYGVTVDISRQKELEAKLEKLESALGSSAFQSILEQTPEV